jgi:hypothetical protein
MKLITSELVTTLYQQITIGNFPIQLVAIRPHLLRWLHPTGSLAVQIQDASGQVIATSPAVAISAIGSDNYWHGYQRFDLSTHLKALATYRIALIPSGGYSFSESAYIGWCNDFDLRKVAATYSPNVGINGALDMEIWESRQPIRRAV